MPKIRDWQLDENSYPLSSYISSWENLSSIKKYSITVYSSENCNIVINYAFDDQLQVVKSDTSVLSGGETFEIFSPLITSYVQVAILDIDSNPCDLKFQAFFYTD